MAKRYEAMFQRLKEEKKIAFVPFVVIGDPDFQTSFEIVNAMIDAGADALELGFAFSDPVADGPVIQQADQRALASGLTTGAAFDFIRQLRSRNQKIPIGLLLYANLVEARSRRTFYTDAHAAGADSILIADVPVIEIAPYASLAKEFSLDQVLIATPQCVGEHLRSIACTSQGYTYVVTRAGVTGEDAVANTKHDTLLAQLKDFCAPPLVLGFGIAKPEHVAAAREAGAAGVICGSALVRRIEENLSNRDAMRHSISQFVTLMKGAT